MAAAQAKWPQAPAGGGAEGELVVDNQTVAAGEAIFKANCVACHGADMKGGIGPNLLDTLWIHGGTPADIRHTITVGVPDKGMLTWGPILGPGEGGRGGGLRGVPERRGDRPPDRGREPALTC